VKARVADGVEATITESTRYPFEDQVTFKIALGKSASFPLYLRIPAWCDKATLTLNGEMLAAPLVAGKLAKISRAWESGDTLVLGLPMDVRTKVWTNNRGTVSIDRGPLTYSVQIKEDYRRHGGTDAWPAWDIFPASPWNYGLTLKDGFQVVKAGWPADDQPFRNEAAPVRIIAKAKKIPNWTLEGNGAVREVIQQPVTSDEPEEAITLIPMGAARLRISALPVIGDAPTAKPWPAVPK
jgi:hypothetical protein